jgi:hypothetical protein
VQKKLTEAAAKVGIAWESLSRVLNKTHVAEHLRQEVVRHLAIQAARAGAVNGELLESPNEMVRDRSSSFILGLAGIQSATSLAEHQHRGEGGLHCVIDLSPNLTRCST